MVLVWQKDCRVLLEEGRVVSDGESSIGFEKEEE